MSHVDEGTLHAYLDGALDTLPAAEAERVRGHLDVCDACQARLEEERAVRDEAAAILGGATLDLGDLPSFEEVRSLSRGAPRGATAGLRIQRMAWAASVVLALGTGWLLRGGIPRPSERLGVDEAASVPSAPPSGTVEEDARSTSPTTPPERERAEATRAQDEPVMADLAAPTPAASRGDVQAGAGEAVRSKAVADRDALVASERSDDRAAGDSLDRAAEVTAPADLWAAAQQRRERPVSQLLPSPSAVASDPLTGRGSLQPAGQEARRVVRPAASAIPMEAFAVARSGRSLVVPGLAVISVAWMDEADLAGAVRVLQLMEGGDTLELVHLPVGVDPALLPPVGDGRTQVLSPGEGGWLAARASVSADVISALLRRLEGGG